MSLVEIYEHMRILVIYSFGVGLDAKVNPLDVCTGKTNACFCSQVVATKSSPGVITATVSAWSFLLTTIDGWSLDPKSWQE